MSVTYPLKNQKLSKQEEYNEMHQSLHDDHPASLDNWSEGMHRTWHSGSKPRTGNARHHKERPDNKTDEVLSEENAGRLWAWV